MSKKNQRKSRLKTLINSAYQRIEEIDKELKTPMAILEFENLIIERKRLNTEVFNYSQELLDLTAFDRFKGDSPPTMTASLASIASRIEELLIRELPIYYQTAWMDFSVQIESVKFDESIQKFVMWDMEGMPHTLEDSNTFSYTTIATIFESELFGYEKLKTWKRKEVLKERKERLKKAKQ